VCILLILSFYKGIVPLWGRQIPYTMMKFACFERTVEALYKFVVPKPRSECTKAEQLIVTFVAGYIGKCDGLLLVIALNLIFSIIFLLSGCLTNAARCYIGHHC